MSSIGAAEVARPFDGVVVELVARRRRDGELDARERGGEGQRRGDVVAVAHEHEPAAFDVAEQLAQREEVGERLARVRAVGQQVHHRQVDRLRHLFERLVGEHPRGDDRAVPARLRATSATGSRTPSPTSLGRM